MNFELGGITIPIAAGLEFSQTYESIGGSIIHRMQSGKAVKQTHYRKLKTTLSGRGWVPFGLDGLDYSRPQLLKCAAPRSIANQSNQFTLPASRRVDLNYEPKGYGLVRGQLVETSIQIQGDIVNLSEITGVSNYHVHYYPEILVFVEHPQTQVSITGAEIDWTIVAEEV